MPSLAASRASLGNSLAPYPSLQTSFLISVIYMLLFVELKKKRQPILWISVIIPRKRSRDEDRGTSDSLRKGYKDDRKESGKQKREGIRVGVCLRQGPT